MEWGILLGLAVIALAIGVHSRMRGKRRRRPDSEAKNIYPLW